MVTEEQHDSLVALSIVTALISFIASMAVITTIILGERGYCRGTLKGIKISKLSFHLIAMVSISDSVRTFGGLFGGPPSDSSLCGFQTFLKVFGGSASFAWVAVINFVMYKLLIDSNKWDRFSMQRYKRIFHVICWSFAFLCALIPTAGGFYENTLGWCFIETSKTGVLLRLFCYYLWTVIVCILICILYIRIYRYIEASGIKWEEIPTVQRLLWYPLIFFCCWFWALLRRAWNVFGDGEAPIALIGLQISITNLYGLFNAIVYGSILRHHLKNASESVSQNNSQNDDMQDEPQNTNQNDDENL
eukprot:680860_1